MANLLKPARATSPGRVLLRELDVRGWSQRDLAAIMGRPYQAINQIVRGVKRITPETARELAQAFGTSPELWMNLEVNYRLQLVKQEKKEHEIARRSHLYSLAPVTKLIRRGQIEGSDDVDELEKQVREYLRAYKQEKAHQSPALPRHS
jgi:HTH-type transcriptional regulator/antitoxin HigA